MAITFFYRWFDKESDAVMLAAEFSPLTADGLRAITDGELEYIAGEPITLKWDNEVAEIGDYVVSDLLGGYHVHDKEIFEAKYYQQ